MKSGGERLKITSRVGSLQLHGKDFIEQSTVKLCCPQIRKYIGEVYCY